jgi:hypothetical protein
MEQQQSTYEYASLDETKREIRLVHLLPSLTQKADGDSSDDVIRCTFSLASPDEPPAFKALSYVWGDPKGVIPIEINEHEVFVTVNIHCALRHLRLPDRERIIWIDALCINQKDSDE